MGLCGTYSTEHGRYMPPNQKRRYADNTSLGIVLERSDTLQLAAVDAYHAPQLFGRELNIFPSSNPRFRKPVISIE